MATETERLRASEDASYWWAETGWRVPALISAAGVLVLALSQAAVALAPEGTEVAAWWPAAGVSVAILARARGRLLFAGLLATLAAATFAGNLFAGREPLVAAVFCLANVAEAAIVVGWMRRGIDTPPALRTFDGLGRLLVGVAIGTSVLATTASAVVALRLGGDYWLTWRQVAASHAAAILLLAPLGLVLPRLRDRRWGLEVAAQGAAAVLIVMLVFAPGQELPLAFSVLPVIAWAAVRFDFRVVVAEMIGIGVGSSLLTSAGYGPFAAAGVRGEAPALVSAQMQVFLVSCAMSALPLAVAVAQRRAALHDVSESEGLLRGVLAAATRNAIIATDRTGTITVFNPGAELLLGYRSDEVVGLVTPGLFHDPNEIEERAVELGIAPGFDVFVADLRSGLDSRTRDWTYVRKDSSRCTVSLTVSRVLDETGALSGYLGVAEDVTASRRAEAALRSALERERQAVDRLEDLDRAKNDFVSTVSHELRTPMTSVLGYTEMLRDGDGVDQLSPDQLELVGRVQRNGQRLMGLIDDLLTLSRVEEGEFTLRPEELDLRGVVRGAREAVETMLAARPRVVECVVPPTAVVLVGDRDHLERAVTNLLTNAIKFTRADGRISLRLEADEQRATITVTDDGIGIPLDEQDRLFTRFFRASSATHHAVQGSGLGLSLVRTIVGAHAGEVDLRSGPGQGTEVTVRLPRASGLVPIEDRRRHLAH
ncbi:MAG: ATP-binding protein [Nocardioides sp.]